MSPGPLLLVAAGSLATGIICSARWPRTWLGLTVTGAGAAFGAALLVLTGQPPWELIDGFPLGGEPLHLRLDGLSALFLALLSVVGAAGAVYAREYWSEKHYPTSAPRGRMWWSALVLSMGVVLTVSNGLHFLMGWELFTVSAFFLVTLDRQRREVRAAGWLYLAASHAGTVCLFAFFAMLACRTGSWNLGPMRDQADLTPLLWLALLGFGVKAGVFPLHIWLPSAHASAPSHVSAIMSGVAIKMGIYGIVRFSGWLPVPAAAGWVVISFGAISALLGIAFAFAQNDYKRLLAYCSVENVGIILIGLGAALLAISNGDAPWGRLALAGALLHVWNHGAFKALLFFGAGSVLHATGTREMSRLGGLWRNMPWTAGLFALGAVAVAGLPPLNGFVSEWLVYLGLFDAATGKTPASGVAMLATVMLGMAGALALASFVKAGAMIFLGASRTQLATKAHESGWGMRGPMVVLATICVAIGLAPMLFWPTITRAVQAWHPAWASTSTVAPLEKLGATQIALALVFVGATAGLWRRVQQNGFARALTWDCGYATPTPRMQYSGGSFSGIGAGWFSWILLPAVRRLRPRGPMPGQAIHQQRVPETVLERVLAPAGELIITVSTAVRRLQHGHLQSYILYIVAGLTALSGLVFLGGKP